MFVSWQCCFSVLFLVTLLSGLGVHAYLAGLDASSSRSPSVLILLVLADLDGSIPWRYSHSSKILFDDLSENIIYYRGISPGNATDRDRASRGSLGAEKQPRTRLKQTKEKTLKSR